MKIRNTLWGFLSLLVFPASTNALGQSIIDNGTYTTINGLDWLDLSATDELTMSEALAQNPTYRMATKDEFEVMLSLFYSVENNLFDGQVVTSWNLANTAYGFFDGYIDDSPTFGDNTYISLFGTTFTNLNFQGSRDIRKANGWFADGDVARYGGIYISDYYSPDATDVTRIRTTTSVSYDPQTTFIGEATGYEGDGQVATFLVRNTLVPEPSSTALLALGGLAAMMRRRRS